MTTDASASTERAPRRADPRRARTRAALVTAGQQLLADGRTAVSIQEITTLADVGFGSFYNHFESKDELFDAAIDGTLLAHDAVLERVTAGIEDAAELFAIGVRTTARLQRRAPEMARVILHHGTGILLRDAGIAPRAKSDIHRGIESGRFKVADAELAFMAVGGALLGLMQHLDEDPTVDAARASDLLAEGLLRLLGLTPKQAEKIAHAPLPAGADDTDPS